MTLPLSAWPTRSLLRPTGRKRPTSTSTVLRSQGNGDPLSRRRACSAYMRIPAAYRRALCVTHQDHVEPGHCRAGKPQDGKLRFRLNRDREIEVRVATVPTAGNNEDIVMRLLTAKEPMPLEAMEFAAVHPRRSFGSDRKASWDPLVRRPDRIGKDDDAPRSPSSPEHGCQENLDGRGSDRDHAGRTQAGAGAAQDRIHVCGLRSFLRADPDVIMIGEMRDKETAEVAVEASLTGHLVLSTLHTNSAVETVTRMLDLGCDPFNFADAMQGILAKRLCKRICGHCKEMYHPTVQEYDKLVREYGSDFLGHAGLRPTETPSGCPAGAAATTAITRGSKDALPCMNS